MKELYHDIYDIHIYVCMYIYIYILYHILVVKSSERGAITDHRLHMKQCHNVRK